ncbi:hypothetical protein ACFQ48_21435 [Hymenobacter caeli]|uniref:Uncharacterized protein n=1 Tax=Hymenobacter caeli TaxID=2735894 RepID=A0ABX2FXG9_9BACT|nr:hypothetical protein [Hymenobacter caeli]NRT21065.1 hypothetical protein [Hymenobacter caeli]
MSLAWKYGKLAGALVTHVLLSGCESKPAPAVVQSSSKVPSAAQPSAQADTATIIQESPLAFPGYASPKDPSEDVPTLHQPFEKIKTVAPGLLVIINSVPVAATDIIRDSSELKLIFTIKRDHKVIFCDTADDGFMYSFYTMPETERLYPIWVPTGPGAGELLVAFNNRPSKELARRFYIKNNQVVKTDTLLTFNGPAKDVDNDGKLEFAGSGGFGEVWDDDQGKRWTTYNPVLYYEVRPTGLVLDSILTRRNILAQYGVFQGFDASNSPGILMKKSRNE